MPLNKFTTLRTNCMRKLNESSVDARKFRQGVGFIGFITSSREDSIHTILTALKDRAYITEKNVEVLFYIFHIMEIPSCKELVQEYMDSNNLVTSSHQSPHPPPPHALTDRIEDVDLMNISEAIPVSELENFAIKGLRFSFIQVENNTVDFSGTKKTLQILKEWSSRAPIGGDASAIPLFNYGGLKIALEKAQLNGVIRGLGLDNYR